MAILIFQKDLKLKRHFTINNIIWANKLTILINLAHDGKILINAVRSFLADKNLQISFFSDSMTGSGSSVTVLRTFQ